MCAKPRSFEFSFALLVVLLVSLVFPVGTAAQSTAAIQGTVTDSTGAVIPGAQVLVRNTGTGEERTAQTDATGSYLVASLPVGTYRVEVKAAGMATLVASNVILEVGKTVLQNFTLKVAPTAETVEVTAQSPVLESLTISANQVIDRKTVQEIPLNGRHFVDLGLLIPGSVTPPQNGFLTAPLRGQGSFAFNTAGNREDTVNYMINGVNLNDMVQNQITFQPSINTVQEFKVDNSTYSAEYGRNSGAIVNIATRSGSNDWHGEVFEFLRNSGLDARNYFNVTPILQSPFKRNQFGAAFGGPIKKDRTFFFASYEGLRQRQGLTINSAVLSAAQRAQAATIANPTVTKLLPLIPAPNFGATRFVGSATAPVNLDQGTINLSHTFRTEDRLNGYLALQQDLRQEPTLQGNTIPGFGDTRQSRRQIATINETHVFRPNLVNEVRLGYNRIRITFSPNTPLNPADFGINGGITTAIGLPQMTVRDIGLNFGGPSGFPQGRGDLTWVVSDTLNYVRGRHTFKFGSEFRRFSNNNFGGDTGTFAFNTVTDFINGNAASFTVNPSFTPNRIYTSALGFFAQDSYKFRPFLTLELGLRYDWNGTPVEAQDRFVIFDPVTRSLLRQGSGIDKVYNQNALNFEPRVGFAWDVFHNGKTVLRSAYAVQADQPVTNLVTGLAVNPPFSAPVAFNGPGTVTFANAFTAAAAAGAFSLTSINHDFRNAYVQSWNFNIQKEITPSLGAMIGYFGSKGTHLRIQRNINQFINGARPFPTISASSSIVPGKALGNINTQESAGNSSYNALWLTANKRLTRGVQFNASYTWSKSLDYNSLNSQGVVIQDSFNIRNDRGLSDYDARHRFVISGLYELPFRGNRAVQGWQFATIVQLQTGNPVNIITNNGSLTGVANTIRPNVSGSVPTSFTPAGNGNLQYLPACSASSCPFTAVNAFGGLGRNVIIGPGFENIDFSILKNTRITERFNLQFRADIFDLFNHPNFGQPARIVSTAAGNTFGQISNTRFPVGDSGSSRQIQLALKLIF